MNNGTFRLVQPPSAPIEEGQRVRLVVDTQPATNDVLALATSVFDGLSDQDINDSETIPATDTSSAQDEVIAAEIRKLEQIEVQAILARDTVTLEKLWDRNYVVNNPDNKVVLANANPVDRPVLKEPRTSFTRDVEHITVRGNSVISMGSETVVPDGDLPKSGEIVKRRYTNIWMNVDGVWKLVARHANVICQTS